MKERVRSPDRAAHLVSRLFLPEPRLFIRENVDHRFFFLALSLSLSLSTLPNVACCEAQRVVNAWARDLHRRWLVERTRRGSEKLGSARRDARRIQIQLAFRRVTSARGREEKEVGSATPQTQPPPPPQALPPNHPSFLDAHQRTSG